MVVPEDAPLFTGSLRQNLDLNNKAPDAELWRILEEVRTDSFCQAHHQGVAEWIVY